MPAGHKLPKVIMIFSLSSLTAQFVPLKPCRKSIVPLRNIPCLSLWIFLPRMRKILKSGKLFLLQWKGQFKMKGFCFMVSEITRQWLEKSHDDLISAGVLMEKIIPPQVEIACYHSQQCAEKALKAYCCHNGADVQRTHNLIVLCQACIAINPDFLEIMSDCASLTPYSVQTRYPNNIEILESEAKMALMLAKRVYDFVSERILADA